MESIHNRPGAEPPSEDTLVSGFLEVTMKERRRCTSISVGVQSVCNLNMGPQRGWEADGIFERGVEILGGDAEGIWLEKGVQTWVPSKMSDCALINRFSFSLLLPATLATHDYHAHGRVSHIYTARVIGIPHSSGIISLFGLRPDAIHIEGQIPYKEDFEAVIARSNRLAADHPSGRRTPSPKSSPVLAPGGLPPMRDQGDDSAIAFGDEGQASVTGLYTRRQSIELGRPSPVSGDVGSPHDDDRRSISSFRSNGSQDGRSESSGWMKGNFCVQRFMLVHANPSPTGGISQLDIRKEGMVEGIGSWRFSASAEVVRIRRCFECSR